MARKGVSKKRGHWTYLILREIRKPLGIIMSGQNHSSRGGRIESIDKIGECHITNRSRVCECVLPLACILFIRGRRESLSLRAILDS